ncbi:MAG: pilus assembly protein PilM [Anaerolineaceae bacterium]|nr:pilus assembly protein PilM [Anaerolineaceae bacterium]
MIEHAKILSQPDADEQQLIRNALDKFLSRNDVKNDLVVVGVPGQASFSRFIKLPPVELRKVPEIVQYEARQQIPFNLNDVIWDYQTMTMPTGGTAEIEVGIFAMKRDIVQDYVNDFTQVKVVPDIVQMAPVALYNYLQYDRSESSGATLLVDVGAENTSLVIADGYRVWIRNFPLGGNNFTQALVKAFKLTFKPEASRGREQVRQGSFPGHASGLLGPADRDSAEHRLLHEPAPREPHRTPAGHGQHVPPAGAAKIPVAEPGRGGDQGRPFLVAWRRPGDRGPGLQGERAQLRRGLRPGPSGAGTGRHRDQPAAAGDPQGKGAEAQASVRGSRSGCGGGRLCVAGHRGESVAEGHGSAGGCPPGHRRPRPAGQECAEGGRKLRLGEPEVRHCRRGQQDGT